MHFFCGVLGPDSVGRSQRLRSLGLAGAVRRFNERAVPGIGGVWFGKQLMLALLGVRVAELHAERGRAIPKIECTNAIEALACWLAYRDSHWASDARLRGRNKFPRNFDGEDGPLYARFRARGFYVTQPMRMASGSAMVPLGLAISSSRRFNTLQTTAEGRAFLDAALDGFRPSNRSMVEHLSQWVGGEKVSVTTGSVFRGLSPCLPLPKIALEHLHCRILAGGVDESATAKARRRSALAWVDRLRTKPPGAPLSWLDRPPEVQDDRHWEDLEAGARLLLARDAALQLLDALEERISHAPAERMTIADAVPAVREEVELLRVAADAFLSMRHEDAEANEFCRACASADPATVLRNLCQRDGRVVALVGNLLQPGGPAFRRGMASNAEPESNPVDEPSDAVGAIGVQGTDDIEWPKGLSFRLQNLYMLNLELNDRLHVRPTTQEGST